MNTNMVHRLLARKAWLILFTSLFIGGIIGGAPAPVLAEPVSQEVETVLQVIETAETPTVTLGFPASFAITVTNIGPVTASNVRISDQMLEGMTWSAVEYTVCNVDPNGLLNCNLGDIAPNASVTVHVSGVTTQAICGQIITNIATVTYNNGPMTPSNAASITLNCPVFTVNVLGDHETITLGDTVGYTIEVANRGNVTENGMTLTDPLPTFYAHDWSVGGTDGSACTIANDLLTCDFGSLAIGAVKSIRLTSPTAYTGTICSSGSFTITNEATASLDNSPYPPFTRSGLFNMNVLCPKVYGTEDVDRYSVVAGEPASYIIEVGNTGGGTARDIEVQFSMPRNPGLNWAVDNLTMPDGTTGSCAFQEDGAYLFLNCNFNQLAWNKTIHITITSPTTTATCNSSLRSAGTVSSSNGGGTKTRDAVIDVNCLALTETADHATINVGDEVGFTYQVANPTSMTVNNVTLHSNLLTSAGLSWSFDGADAAACTITDNNTNTNKALTCTFGSLAPNAAKTIHITSPTPYDSTACRTAPYKISNTGFITADGQTLDNSAIATTSVLCPSIYTLEYVDNMKVSAGDPLNLTVEAGNGGAGSARQVLLTYPLPANPGMSWSITSVTKPDSVTGSCAIDTGGAAPRLECSFDTLAKDQGATVQLTSPTTSATCGSAFEIGGRITASNGGEYTSMPTPVDVLCSALPITVTADTGPFSAGDLIGFTVEVHNPYPVAISSVRITDTPDPETHLEWTVDQQASPACSLDNGVIKCSAGTLAPNATYSVHVFAASSASTCALQVDNNATVSDARGQSSSASDHLTVSCPDLSLTKTTTTATITPTDTIRFDLTVTNNGQGIAREATLQDTLPTSARFDWTIGGTDGAACTIANGVLTCPFGDMAPGAVKSISLSSPTSYYNLPMCGSAAHQGTITNTAVVSAYNEAENQTADNRASASINVLCPFLISDPWSDSISYVAGAPITFQVKITNEGADTARAVEAGADLPTNPGMNWSITSVTPTSAAPNCSITNIDSHKYIWCTFDQMAPQEQVVITLTSPTTSSSCGALQSGGMAAASNSNQYKSKYMNLSVICPTVTMAVDQAGYTRDYAWSIDKTVDSNNANTNLDPVAFDYTVTVTQTGFTDSAWLVQGKISVTNPHAENAISGLTVTAEVDNGGTCTLTGGTDVSIPAGGSVELDYSCTYATKPDYSGSVTARVGGTISSDATPFAFETLDTLHQAIDVTDSFNGVDEKVNTDPIIASDQLDDLTTQILKFTREAPAPTSLCQEYTFTSTIPGTEETASQTVRVCRPSLVTDSTLCTFDEDSATPAIDLRLILTPDTSAPNTFKLNASNPGQFYYNLFYANTTEAPIAPKVTLTLPYPFVTQGAVPLHVYDDFSVSSQNGQTCLTPGMEAANSKAPVFGMSDWGNSATFGSTREIQIQLPEIPANRFFYANLHLDYGLKDSAGYTRGLNNSAGSPTITLPNPQLYTFADSLKMTHELNSMNVFKKNPGIGGQVASGSTMNPVSNVRIDIFNSSQKLLGTTYTDEDGWYMWAYKYTGKATTFYVKVTVPGYSMTQEVVLKSNAFAVANFLDLP